MTKLIVVIGFIVAFVAGVMVSPQIRPTGSTTAAPTTRPKGHGSFLTAELNLTAEQQQQMEKIWNETAQRGRAGQDEAARQSRKERDEQIAALVRPEDRSKYDAIIQGHTQRMDLMEKEWHAAYDRAVEQTRAILTDEQRIKYDELRTRHERERAAHPASTQPTNRNSP